MTGITAKYKTGDQVILISTAITSSVVPMFSLGIVIDDWGDGNYNVAFDCGQHGEVCQIISSSMIKPVSIVEYDDSEII